MICPTCGGETTVDETREVQQVVNRRRRRCATRACGVRFTTYEIVVPDGFGNTTAGRGRLRIIGEADLERLRAALATMLESIL